MIKIPEFKDKELLEQAFIHRSYLNEAKKKVERPIDSIFNTTFKKKFTRTVTQTIINPIIPLTLFMHDDEC